MGITRSDLFSEDQNNLAQLAKVLGHPARIAILEYVAKANSCINSDLVNELGLAQATISQHLKELKNAGLIQGTINGTAMNYCIHAENWDRAAQIFNNLFTQKSACPPEGCDC
jgi:predicted transcriptional regulator